jgi:hypothetical protein
MTDRSMRNQLEAEDNIRLAGEFSPQRVAHDHSNALGGYTHADSKLYTHAALHARGDD